MLAADEKRNRNKIAGIIPDDSWLTIATSGCMTFITNIFDLNPNAHESL